MKTIIRLALLLSCTLLSSCSFHRLPLFNGLPAEDSALWPEQETYLDSVQSFSVQGNFLVSVPFYRHEGHFEWHQKHNRILAFFYTRDEPEAPFMTLTMTGNEPAEIKTADGKVYRHPSAQTLVREVTRLSLPVDAMPYWLKGLPEPLEQRPSPMLVHTSGELYKIKQSGWVVYYPYYQKRLPSRLQLHSTGMTLTLDRMAWIVH